MNKKMSCYTKCDNSFFYYISINIKIYFFQDKQAKILILGFACLGFFLLMYLLKHFYDKIIFWAKPDDVELMLFK